MLEDLPQLQRVRHNDRERIVYYHCPAFPYGSLQIGQGLLQQCQHVDADFQGHIDPCGMENGGGTLVHGLSLLHGAAGTPSVGTLGTNAERGHEGPETCRALDRVYLKREGTADGVRRLW